MSSPMFTLLKGDWVKGLAVAVIAAVLTYLMGVINAPNFNFAMIDWAEILKMALVAGVSYLGKNFVTDNQGKVLGAIPTEPSK